MRIISSGLVRERKPKVYASYNICECCVHGQEQEKRGGRGTTSSNTRRRESVSSTVSRTERAVSAPPQTTTVSPKKQVKFVKRSVSEPTKSSVEEELGLLGKLRLAKEVKKDTIGRLRDDC